jgi:hypothetical protein
MIVPNDCINPAVVFQQQRDQDERKTPVYDDDAVAQSVEAIVADEGQRPQQYPGHCRSDKKSRERRQHA